MLQKTLLQKATLPTWRSNFGRTCSVFLLFTGIFAHASAPQVEVSPSRSVDGGPVQFKIVARAKSGESISNPNIPAFQDWTVLDSRSSSSSNTVMVGDNLQMEFVREFLFTLQPNRSGTLTIPSARIQVGKTTYETPPIDVRVDVVKQNAPSNRPPARNLAPSRPDSSQAWTSPWEDVRSVENTFVRAEPSKTTVFAGELVYLTYALYTRTPQSIGNFQNAKFPQFKGFLKEELFIAKKLESSTVNINGRLFQRAEIIRYALFPLKEGNLKIDPYVFRYEMLPSASDILNFDFLDPNQIFDPGSIDLRPIPQEKQSNIVEITVKPLPPPPPGKVHGGAVGVFSMELLPPVAPGVVGQPLTFSLRMDGLGNVKSFPEPRFVYPEGLTPLQTRSRSEIRENATSTRTFEYSVIAKTPGTFEVPPLDWTFFDPAKQSYETLTTPSFRIEVAASGTPLANSSNEPSQAAAPAPTTSWTLTLQQFMDSALLLEKRYRAVWATTLAALLSFFGVVALVKRMRRRNEEASVAFPWVFTERELKKTSDPIARAVLMDRWITQRLSGEESLNLDLDCSRSEMLSALQQYSPAEHHSHLKELEDIWNKLDRIRFSGSQKAAKAPTEQVSFESLSKLISKLIKSKR